MATKPKAQWRAIDIPGQREAYVAVFNGREIGTIAKTARNAAWSIYAGIGQAARLVGTCYAKEGAKYMLLTAPEHYWRPAPTRELTAEESTRVKEAYARDGSETAIQLAAQLSGTTQWPVAAKIVDTVMDQSPFTVL